MGMLIDALSNSMEKLIRVPAGRRGVPVELRVHYEVTRGDACDTYQILSIEETGSGTGTC
jgi:hypothetical protein